MSELNATDPAALALLLSSERSQDERLSVLQTLHDQRLPAGAVELLCSTLRAERSTAVRRGLLGLLLAQAPAFQELVPLGEVLIAVCAGDPEEELRLLAAQGLSRLSPKLDGREETLAELLLHERGEELRAAALEGLAGSPARSPATALLLVRAAPLLPASLRPQLLALLRQLPVDEAERGLVALLSPWEPEPLRVQLLQSLEEQPSLSPAAVQALSAQLLEESSPALRARTFALLARQRGGAQELARLLLVLLGRVPDAEQLVAGLLPKLDAVPELLPELTRVLQQPGPARRRLLLLPLLERARACGALAVALGDVDPWVRSAAISAAGRSLSVAPELLVPALLAQASREPLPELRETLAEALAKAPRLQPAEQRELLLWLGRERSQRVVAQLVQLLPGVQLSEETRGPLLGAFLQVLRDPFAPVEAREAASERLRSFAFRDEPQVAELLTELLAHAEGREEAARWDDQLRKLVPDARDRAPLVRTLLLRFLGDYPAEPTAIWARELHGLAAHDPALRAFVPTLVALTGESWMLSAAEAADKKSGLLPLVRELLRAGKPDQAQRRIDEAWNERSLRKADLLALLERLLVDVPTEYGVLQTVLQILSKGKVAPPEVQSLCLRFLQRRPRSQMAYAVKSFLSDVARAELGYGERVVAAFDQESFSNFLRTTEQPREEKEVPATLNDWEYRGWRGLEEQWPLAELFFELQRREATLALLATPPAPGVPVLGSLQYLILKELWRRGDGSAEELEALRALVAATGAPRCAPLHDRALLLVWKRWPAYVRTLEGAPPAAALAQLATEAFLHLAEVLRGFGPASKEKLPEPPTECDPQLLRARFPLGEAVWKEQVEKQLARVQEVRAKELLQVATALANKGKQAQAAGLIDRLLGPFAGTRLVQQKRAELEGYRQQLGR